MTFHDMYIGPAMIDFFCTVSFMSEMMSSENRRYFDVAVVSGGWHAPGQAFAPPKW